MSMQTQEARFKVDEITRDDVLRLIPGAFINPLFLRPHLDRELVIGTIGDRGGGKSASDATICLVDYAMRGKRIVSNMSIDCDIEIDDETAQLFGLNTGGIASYRSEPLEKDALLELDERYYNCVIEIEEINVQYSNVRRFMANTNVDFNEVCQQLRKFKITLIYNVIDEMFIDPQLRELTDIFIKTYDTCFDADALAAKKSVGLDFKWKIYPISGYLCGEQGKYKNTKKAIDGVYFDFGRWHGIHDTTKHQEKGIYSMSTKDKNKRMLAKISATSSPETIAEMDKWGWLADLAIQWKKEGITELRPVELSQRLGTRATREIKEQLKVWGVYYDNSILAYRVADEGGL